MLLKLTVVLLLANQILCEDQPKIVIVGAGTSGLAAAVKLLKNGLTDIKILEAQDRIGGRVNSVKFGDAYVDLGAEFCHGEEGNPVWPMVKDLGLVKHSNFTMYFMGSHGDVIDDEFSVALDKLVEKYAESSEDMEIQKECPGEVKLGACLKQLYQKDITEKYKDDPVRSKLIKPGLKWLERTISSFESAFSLDDVRSSSNYADIKGDFALNWNGNGYRTFFDILLGKYPDKKGLPVEEKIEFNKEVEKISLSDNKITVKTKDGSTYDAEHVIMTPSVGILKERHEAMFEPKLPDEKIKAIKGIGFGAVVKVVLRFPEAIWDQSDDEDILWRYIWTDEDEAKIKEEFPEGITMDGKMWVTNLVDSVNHRKNPKVLTAWYAGNAIPEIEKLPKDVVVNGTMYVFKKFAPKNWKVVDPEESIVTNWWSNPFFRGTWTYESIDDPSGEQKLPDKLALPITGSDGKCMVQFAGEATSLNVYGTVGGAMEAGFREADRIIEVHKKK